LWRDHPTGREKKKVDPVEKSPQGEREKKKVDPVEKSPQGGEILSTLNELSLSISLYWYIIIYCPDFPVISRTYEKIFPPNYTLGCFQISQ